MQQFEREELRASLGWREVAQALNNLVLIVTPAKFR